MSKDFYIFRHGQSTYNLEKRTQGQTNDSVLTEIGREQALNIGRKLQNCGIEVIVTSPLMRAFQTAELVNQTLNVPIVEDDHFLEVNVGVVEGWHYTEIIKKYKKIFDQLHSTDFDSCADVCYPQGETKRQVHERIWQGLEKWSLSLQNYQTIAISSHGIALSQILYSLGIKNNEIANGTIVHIQKENEKWKFIEMI